MNGAMGIIHDDDVTDLADVSWRLVFRIICFCCPDSSAAAATLNLLIGWTSISTVALI